MEAVMQLITDTIREQLIANGRMGIEHSEFDPQPVVKLFTPDAGATWLISECDPQEPDILYGLCDPGLGEPSWAPPALRRLRRCNPGAVQVSIGMPLIIRKNGPGGAGCSPTRAQAISLLRTTCTPRAASRAHTSSMDVRPCALCMPIPRHASSITTTS